jgi:1,2-phenylacetyl-CoA epoxidase PaaB subunit
MQYDVKLIHGTYEKVVSVHADDDEEALCKARGRAKREGFYCLPMAYESAKIVGRAP